jgi:FlaA1/EpsC-like NDP-sugar epimerase
MQAAQIQNTINRALEQHSHSAKELPSNFVYLYPTSLALTSALLRVGSLIDVEAENSDEARLLKSLESKYTESFSSPIIGEVVLLTGSTGALGSAVLSVLAHDTDVAKIYAINRQSKDEADL